MQIYRWKDSSFGNVARAGRRAAAWLLVMLCFAPGPARAQSYNKLYQIFGVGDLPSPPAAYPPVAGGVIVSTRSGGFDILNAAGTNIERRNLGFIPNQDVLWSQLAPGNGSIYFWGHTNDNGMFNRSWIGSMKDSNHAAWNWQSQIIMKDANFNNAAKQYFRQVIVTVVSDVVVVGGGTDMNGANPAPFIAALNAATGTLIWGNTFQDKAMHHLAFFNSVAQAANGNLIAVGFRNEGPIAASFTPSGVLLLFKSYSYIENAHDRLAGKQFFAVQPWTGNNVLVVGSAQDANGADAVALGAMDVALNIARYTRYSGLLANAGLPLATNAARTHWAASSTTVALPQETVVLNDTAHHLFCPTNVAQGVAAVPANGAIPERLSITARSVSTPNTAVLAALSGWNANPGSCVGPTAPASSMIAPTASDIPVNQSAVLWAMNNHAMVAQLAVSSGEPCVICQ